ncbi:MAG: DNA repair protein RecO [Actinomycetia bacterium]|nr:DNA repair protein RecO [Actinomycetes bacterium]
MAGAYRVRALALRKTKLGESDLIVTLLAADGCQIRAVGKGVRKTSSRFGARLEPFTVVDLMLSPGRSLEIITEAQTVTSHSTLRSDYDRLCAASVLADFLDKVSVECQAEERLFALATTTLDAMETAEIGDLRALVVAFLVKGMAMQGYRPQLAACACCAGPTDPDDVRFSLAAGGVVCAACASADASVVRVAADMPVVIDALLRAKLADVAALGIPAPLMTGTFGLVKAFVTYHLPARMKALEAYARAVALGP